MKNTSLDRKDFIIAIFNSYMTFKGNLKKVYNEVNKERIMEWQL
jgi:hypothetical protein